MNTQLLHLLNQPGPLVDMYSAYKALYSCCDKMHGTVGLTVGLTVRFNDFDITIDEARSTKYNIMITMIIKIKINRSIVCSILLRLRQ